MKKIMLVMMVVLLSGCGKNPFFPPVNSNANNAASAVATAISIAKSAAGMMDGNANNAPEFKLKKAPGKNQGFPDPLMDPVTGWLTMENPGETINFRYLINGAPVTGYSDILALLAYVAVNSNGFQIQITRAGISQSDLTVVFDHTGFNPNTSEGGLMTGTTTITELGQTITVTYTDFKVTTAGVISGGTVTASFTDASGTWSVSITFAADSTGNGIITGPSYSATIHINSDGSGYFTDSAGTHAIEDDHIGDEAD